MSSRLFGVSLDLGKNELQNAVVQNLGSAPSSPVEGQIYYDSGTHVLFYRNNSAWIDALARANHSGTQLAATISDFDTQVRTSRLDQMAAPTSDVSINSHKLTNVSNGTSANDAVNKSQLDAVLNGRTWKDAVRLVTTSNKSLSGLSSIDSITPVANDRILVTANTTASQNGIWLAQSGAWTRPTDYPAAGVALAGDSVLVTEGTLNGDTQWTLTTDNPITIDSTSTVWAKSGSGTTYSQGTGISISGSTIAVDTSVVARKYATDIGDGSSTSITVTHSLSTKDVIVQIFDNSSPFAQIEAEIDHTTTSAVTVKFNSAPGSAQYRVVVHG